jgi:hypothetical protein
MKGTNQMFGEYFQSVLEDLVVTHGWDDPYAAISPQYHCGRWIDMIYNGFNTGATVKTTAAVIHANSTTEPVHV